MRMNVLIDFLIGLTPMLGDFADGFFKANTKNCRILQERLEEVYGPKVVEVEAIGEGWKGNKGGAFPIGQRLFMNERRRPEAAQLPEARQGGGRWYDMANRRERQPIVEGRQPYLEAGPVQVEQVRQDTHRSRK